MDMFKKRGFYFGQMQTTCKALFNPAGFNYWAWDYGLNAAKSGPLSLQWAQN